MGEGQSVKFTLTITSKPELDSIKWYKDGKKIKKDDHFVIVKDDPSYSLEIIGITQEDIAIYSCTASNEEGSSTTTASIKFQDKTAPFEKLDSILSTETESDLTELKKALEITYDQTSSINSQSDQETIHTDEAVSK